MQSYEGDGYFLDIITKRVTQPRWVGPGFALSYAGEWTIGRMGVFVHLKQFEGAYVTRVSQAVTKDPDAVLAVMRPTACVMKMPVVKTDKPWGSEHSVQPHIGLLKIIDVFDGARTSLQRHRFKDEVLIPVDAGPTGDAVTGHIPPGMIHRVTGPMTLLEASTYHPDDVERLEDDYSR